MRELVADSFLADAPVVAVSSRTGDGLAALGATLAAVAASVPVRRTDGPVRLPVDRVFSMKGFGTVATGTLVSGRVEIDQSLAVLPRHRVVKVRGLQVHGRSQAAAEAGRRVAINLGGVEVSELARGDTLANRVPSSRPGGSTPVSTCCPTRGRCGRARACAFTVAQLRSWDASGLRGAAAGRRSYARIHLESPAIVTRGDRFILRAYSPLATIGGGVVLDPRPPRVSIRSATGAERLRQFDTHSLDDDGAVTVFVNEAGGTGLARSALVSRAGLSYREADEAVARLTKGGAATLIGTMLVSPRACTELSERLLAALRAHHETHPHAGGMPREEARERLFRRVAPEIFQAVLDGSSRRAGSSRATGSRSPARGSRSQIPSTRAQEALERVYRDAGLTPPDLPTAAAAAGTTLPVAERMILLLVRARTLVKLDTLLFHVPRSRAQGRHTADEGRTGRSARRRRVVQGALRHHAEVCDSVARISGPGAGDAANGREPDRAVATRES